MSEPAFTDGLPLSRARRELELQRRIDALAGGIAAVLVQPVTSVLAEQFSENLVEPVAGHVGYQELIRGDQPAPGANYVYTVPGALVLWPLSVLCRLTTSGAAGLRSLVLELWDPNGERYLVAGTQAQLDAGQTGTYCFHPLAGDVAWPVDDAALAPLPQQHIYAGHAVVLRVAGADAGDQISGVRISAWLYPTGPPPHAGP